MFNKLHVFLSLILLLLPSRLALAQQSDLTISGLYRTLFTHTQSLYTKEDISAFTHLLRLEAKKAIGPWSFHVAMDNEALLNDFANTTDFDFIRSQTQDRLAAIDLDKTSVDNAHLFLQHSLYRGYVKYYTSKWQVIVGKQSIDWGKLRFYSPLDVFNSIAPTSTDDDKRIAIDAININISPEDFVGINFILAPDENLNKSSAGARYSRKIGTYDFSIMGASVRDDLIVGLSFDGYIKNAGFRGELSFIKQSEGRSFPRIGLGIDYNFSNKVYLLFEHFVNGGHEDNDIAIFTSSYQQSRRTLSIQKQLSSIWLSYQWTPLITTDTFLIYDWQRQSFFLNPEINYNIQQNIDISAGTQLFWGTTESEFGAYENLHYAKMKWFF